MTSVAPDCSLLLFIKGALISNYKTVGYKILKHNFLITPSKYFLRFEVLLFSTTKIAFFLKIESLYLSNKLVPY
jgi:hypothetical protein